MSPLKLVLALLLCLATALPAAACVGEEDCNPEGTANQEIACAHNDNVARANTLKAKLGDKVCDVFKECAQEHTGGGSGGHADRVTCVYEKLNELEK